MPDGCASLNSVVFSRKEGENFKKKTWIQCIVRSSSPIFLNKVPDLLLPSLKKVSDVDV